MVESARTVLELLKGREVTHVSVVNDRYDEVHDRYDDEMIKEARIFLDDGTVLKIDSGAEYGYESWICVEVEATCEE